MQRGTEARQLPLTWALLTLLLLARYVGVVPAAPSWSVPTLLAYAWQDLLIVLLFGVAEVSRLPRSALVATYAALVILAAFNVPVMLVLGSPLTVPILRAARGTLADSILHHAGALNTGLFVGVLVAGALLPLATRRVRVRFTRPALALALLSILGWFGARTGRTDGLDRHPLVSILRTAIPRVAATAAAVGEGDWRSSPVRAPGDAADDARTALKGAATGRNVLLVVLESTGAGYLRAYGAERDPTPNLSSLASSSLLVENAYAVYPESIRGLLTYLSSRYPGFDVPNAAHAGIARPSLATILGEKGYRTALVHSGRFIYLGMSDIVRALGFERTLDAGDISGNANSSFGVDEEAAVEVMLGWLDSLDSAERFFLTYLPIAGHHPYASSGGGPFDNSDDQGRYLNALHEGDAAIGRLLAGLSQRGRLDNTVVVVVGDHGEAFGEHAGNFGHTLAIFEENIRVPFFISLPGSAAALTEQRIPMGSLLDLAPTALDLLGLESPAEFQGASLLGPADNMALFFTDYSLGLLGLRDRCWKFIHEVESGRGRLFDLCRDPGESIDVASDHRDAVDSYTRVLRRWIAAQTHNARSGMDTLR